jgi:hypothetical protein
MPCKKCIRLRKGLRKQQLYFYMIDIMIIILYLHSFIGIVGGLRPKDILFNFVPVKVHEHQMICRQ